MSRLSSRARSAAKAFTTCFGIGNLPFCPGTFGSVFGAMTYYLFLKKIETIPYFVFILLVSVLAVLCIELSEDDSSQDPSYIVIDEYCGVLVSLCTAYNLFSIVAGFALFRFFDILKPFPVGYLDKNIKGGPGIMLDDIAAGLLASLSLYVLEYINGGVIFFG